MMDRRAFVTGTLAFLAAPLVAEAQPTGTVYRIGCILTATPDEMGYLVEVLSARGTKAGAASSTRRGGALAQGRGGVGLDAERHG
jgi:hypothetical protein